MTEHSAGTDARRVEQAREALNATPWWRPLKRQDAARDYRYALLRAALHEARVIPPAVQWETPPYNEAKRREAARIYEGEPGYVIPPA